MATEQLSSEPGQKKKRTRQPKPRLRHYDMEDAVLLQSSRTKHKHFVNNLAAFTAFDADLDAAFAAAWLASIEECEQHPTQATAQDDVQIQTDQLDSERALAFGKVNDLEYYVRKAFPKDELILREFGFKERSKLRTKSISTVVWMQLMKEIAADYMTELTNAGMPLSVINALDQDMATLGETELNQELAKRYVIRQLRLRIQKFNRLYSFFTTVHRAAQSVFSGDKEKKELFDLR